jgi:hypothetical protein
MTTLMPIPVEIDRWVTAPGRVEVVEHRGRRCLRFADDFATPIVRDLELEDGVIEVDLLVPGERTFHGVVWHAAGDDYESFFVRPHQVGNPDAIQYTPVTNGISAWQLYHGPGFWSPITFPLGDWFTIRIELAGERADVYVVDMETPTLAIRAQKLGRRSGAVGLLLSGPGLHVARFATTHERPALRGAPIEEGPAHPGTTGRWEVSEAFPEAMVDGLFELPAELFRGHRWTVLDAEATGLANLGRVNGITDDRNTVLARTTIQAAQAGIRRLELGFSDRATLFLNGRALFRGDETYRNRDYRFLGSIGWWDTVYLPLEAGGNELVVAVAEDFGGWGIQARLLDD